MVRNAVSIFASYLIAAVVAAATVLAIISLIDMARGGANGVSLVLMDAGGLLGGAIVVVLLSALVPFGVALWVLNRLSLHGWWAHVLAGLVVSLVAQFVLAPRMLLRPWEVVSDGWFILVGGAVGGLCYWVVKRWLDRLGKRLPH